MPTFEDWAVDLADRIAAKQEPKKDEERGLHFDGDYLKDLKSRLYAVRETQFKDEMMRGVWSGASASVHDEYVAVEPGKDPFSEGEEDAAYFLGQPDAYKVGFIKEMAKRIGGGVCVGHENVVIRTDIDTITYARVIRDQKGKTND